MPSTDNGSQTSTFATEMLIPVITTKSKSWLKPTDQMDTWLDSQGFYRKHIARDASSLFRCVSEQIFLTQVHHLTVRKHCIQFALYQTDIFRKLTVTPVKEYIERLSNQKEFGTVLDMEIISLIYQVDFAMYKEIKKPLEKITSNGFKSFIVLSLSYDHHYDSVYPKQHIVDAAICQSILYEMLYKCVFKLEEVDYAVNKMLHDKTARYQPELNVALFTTGFQMRLEMRDNCKNVKELLNCGITPFPYKVAKSLDPNIYRNVEYDTWNDQRKCLKHGFIFWNNKELQVGARCIINFNEDNQTVKRHGYIQHMDPNRGPVVVFVEELGEKLTVPYENLELLPPVICTNQPDGSVPDICDKIKPKDEKDCEFMDVTYQPSNYNSISTKIELEDSHSDSKISSPNCLSDVSNIHYIHANSNNIPTTCYACATSHNFHPEMNEIKSSPVLLHSSENSKINYNINTNEVVADSFSVPVQHPVPIYPVLPPDFNGPPPLYPNILQSKSVSTDTDIGSSIRMSYNDPYRYGIQTIPCYMITPNYMVSVNNEQTISQQPAAYPPTSYSLATPSQNDVVYIPVNPFPNVNREIPLHSTQMVTYAPPMSSLKKIHGRNINGSDYINRSNKEVMYAKEPVAINAVNSNNIPVVPTNVYPLYNGSYPIYSQPGYYHPYDYNETFCSITPEIQSNVIPASIYHTTLPITYTENSYQPDTQIYQPILPVTHH